MKRTILLLTIPLMFLSAWGAEDKSQNAKTDVEEIPLQITAGAKNLMEIRVNAAGFLWVKMSGFNNFINSFEELCDLARQFINSQPREHVIAIVTLDKFGIAPQPIIDKVKQELQETYQTVRNEEAKKMYGKAYKALKDDQKRVIREYIPYRVLELKNVSLVDAPEVPTPPMVVPAPPEIMEVVDSTDVEFPEEELLSPEEEKKLKPEQSAEFPGDVFAWLNKNIKYPQDCVKDGVSGRVSIQFVVDRDGAITDTKVLRSPDPRLSAEALRVVESMPKWKPARDKGHSVRMRYVLPVKFKLPEPEVTEDTIDSEIAKFRSRMEEVTVAAYIPAKKTEVKELDKKPAKQATDKNDDRILDVPTESAEFPGDIYAWIAKNIKYPPTCQEKHIQGQVTVAFVVGKDGSIEEADVLCSPDLRLSTEALRLVLSMPKWNPARRGKEFLRMRYTLPINFKLTSPPEK